MPKYNFNDTLNRLNGDAVSRSFCGIQFTGDRKDEDAIEKFKTDPVPIGDMIAHFVLDVVEIESRDARTGQAIPKKLSDKEKFDRFQLAEKIYDRGDDGIAEITEDQRQLILSCADTASNAELYGLVRRWLNKPLDVQQE